MLALSSTIGRLTAGFLSDFISSPNRTNPISRIPLFFVLGSFHVFALFFLSYAPIPLLTRWISASTILIGLSYGGVFTLAPTVVSVIWGIGGFGRNWGILTFTPGKLPTTHTPYFQVIY